MQRSRSNLSAAIVAVLFALAGCGGSGGQSAGPVPQNLPPGPPNHSSNQQSTTIALSATGTPQRLPAVNGIASTIQLPANNGGRATLTVTLSSAAPQNMVQIPADSTQPLLYFTLQASADATLDGLPAFTMTLPAAPKSQGAFYAWMYDARDKTWTDLAPMQVHGNNVTFGGTSHKITLGAGVQYVAVPFTAAAAASCPTPAPTPTPTPVPTPTPTAPPISGKWYLATTDTNIANASLNTYDEQTGNQLSSLALGYQNGVFPTQVTLSKNAASLYVTAYGPLVNGNPSTFPLPGLTIINAATNAIAHQTTIDGGILAGALSPDQTKYYAVGEDVNGNEFYVFDASTGALLKSVVLPDQMFQVLIDPAGTTAYLTGNSPNIDKVDLSSYALSTFTTACNCTGYVQIDSTGSKLFIIQNNTITIVSTVNGATLGTVTPPPNFYTYYNDNEYGASEAGNYSTFLVGDGFNDGSYGFSTISTASQSITATFPANVTGTAAVNQLGTFAVFYLPTELPPYPSVYARALPLGQLYYTETLPANTVPFAAATQ